MENDATLFAFAVTHLPTKQSNMYYFEPPLGSTNMTDKLRKLST